MLPIPRVHLISDARAPLGVLGSIERALRADLPEPIAVHLRQDAPDPELLRLGEALRTITRARGHLFFVNRRLDIAIALGADGVHLPERGLDISSARLLLGKRRYIGVSRHDSHGILERSEGADYAFLSPVGPVPGKRPPLKPEGFSAIAKRAALPIIALGGIDAPLLARLRKERAAHGFAAMRSILHADDPCDALLSLYRVFSECV